MSTCPEKDIHSIYLDNELPKEFVKKYETHLASCDKCRAELEKMKRVRNAFALDKGSIELSDEFLDESFERLKSRIRFKKIVAPAKRPIIVHIPSFVTAVAAAMAVFALMLPFTIKSNRAAPQQTIVIAGDIPVLSRADGITPVSNRDVFVQGSVPYVTFHTRADDPYTYEQNMTLKASRFEVLRSDDAGNLTIRLTNITNSNSINVPISAEEIEVLGFLK